MRRACFSTENPGLFPKMLAAARSLRYIARRVFFIATFGLKALSAGQSL
jgi:hypothetical protein